MRGFRMQVKPGQVYVGKVVARRPFGVFVEILPEIIGLVKIVNANLCGKGPTALPEIGREVHCEVIESAVVNGQPKVNLRIVPVEHEGPGKSDKQ